MSGRTGIARPAADRLHDTTTKSARKENGDARFRSFDPAGAGLLAFAVTPQDREALEKLQRAFADCRRPDHFTNFEHCGECAEHETTLSTRTPESLKIQDVGNPGWDPICFVSPAGFAYYLPGLARLVFEAPPYGYSWYGCQLFWHLISDGPGNARYLHLSPEQRQAVAAFLGHLIETRTEQIESECVEDEAVRAHQIWSGSA